MKKIFLFLLLAISLKGFSQQTFDIENKYAKNLGSTFTDRSLIDKRYVDSARNKARDSVVALIGTGNLTAAYHNVNTYIDSVEYTTDGGAIWMQLKQDVGSGRSTTTNYTLTQPTFWDYTGAGNTTWTLPETQTANRQKPYIIYNRGEGAITLQVIDAGKNIVRRGDTATSITIAKGEVVYIRNSGNFWLAADWGGSNSAQSKAVTVELPSATEVIDLFYTDVAITITKVAEVLRGTTPSVTYDIVFSSNASSGSPSELFGTDRTTTTTTGTTVTSFSDATIPAGSFVWLKTSATSGTITSSNVTIIFTTD